MKRLLLGSDTRAEIIGSLILISFPVMFWLAA
jgi:hypothetical protein